MKKKSLVDRVLGAAEESGFGNRPSVRMYLVDYDRKLARKGLAPEEIEVCTAALVAAGIEIGKDEDIKMLKIKHIKKGWEQISLGPGNCPPYRCSTLSILGRINEIEIMLPEFKTIVDKAKE